MSKTRKSSYRWAALVLLAVPAMAIAGISPQGISPQGISPQGISPQGISPQGISPQGISPQGISPQGISPQGISPQGISPQGISPQGSLLHGVALMGTDVVAADGAGVIMTSVDIRGTTATSGIVSHELTGGPGMSSGPGGYIAVGPMAGSAAGHYATAHMVQADGVTAADDLDLYIARESVDPVPNLLHRTDQQDNDDVTLYTVFMFHKWSGQWVSMCPFDELTGGATAMAIPENPTAEPKKFAFACTATGVAAKCARRWGFRPWRQGTTFKWNDANQEWVEESFDLKPFYDACKVAAQAAYCQDGRSFTRDGTLVDLFDTRQFIWPNSIENPFNMSVDDSRWMFAQEYFIKLPQAGDPPGALLDSALQRSRWRDLDPFGSCGGSAVVNIDRLERDHFEDGRWANPLDTAPRLQVFSPTHCSHREDQVGPGLPWDCSPCTTAVCRTLPHCCALDPNNPSWDATCVAQASLVCPDGMGGIATGKVWPDDLPPARAFAKYLTGPAGAVQRIDGVSTATGSATVQGWACDPEYPGAVSTVEIWNGPREAQGSVSLGAVRADQPLAAGLAGEVALACQGPNKGTARLGFSFAIPAGTTGNVFVYALDTETPDGPAAPPTLLRNGLVRVPTCAHSEHEAGAALASACSACVEEVCSANAACCETGWDASCVTAAASCADNQTSAAISSQTFSAVTTGWVEAPATGSYVFESAGLPSRVFVNGSKVLDWFAGAGTTSGSIQLQRGGKYHLRWDRYQAAALSPPGSGLTWQQPGTVGQTAIPTSVLYRVTPGGGTGLAATYVGPGPINVQRIDPVVSFTAKNPPFPAPTPPTGYTAFWSGEVIPLHSESYTFSVQSAGPTILLVGTDTIIQTLTADAPVPPAPAPHSPCVLGEKLLDDGSDLCVSQVCAEDPFCCNGGYLSYYSTEPTWDAKCVAEARQLCNPSVCTGPPPSASTRELHGTPPQALQAGVRYRLLLAVQNNTADPNVSLSWESAKQHKEVIPTHALYPAQPAATAKGSGLNVTLFKAATDAAGVPQLTTLLASGSVTDLSLAPALGPTGLPLVEVIPAAPTPAQLRPAAPALVVPRFEGHATIKGGKIQVRGLGGLAGGAVVVQDGALVTVLPVASGGSYSGEAAVGVPGTRELKLYQSLRPDGSCPLLTDCSPAIGWTVTMDSSTAGSVPAPKITAPRDLSHAADPADNVFEVTGTGIDAPVHVCEEGGAGASVISSNITAGPDGTITGKVTLSAGTSTNPLQGWHKLRFTQATDCATATASEKSAAVFVSVGISPPTVEFPRTGAEIDCAPTPDPIKASGSVPYTQAQFGNLFVAEETGRANPSVVVREVPIVQRPGGGLGFDIQSISLSPGKHLLYFFQMPSGFSDLRAFASLANTPRSRIEVRIPPRRLLPPTFDLDRTMGTFIQFSNSKSCSTGGLACALPHADVNVRMGGRLWTFRADQNGLYGGVIHMPPGWYEMDFKQVVDSFAGGGWQESCPSEPFKVGLQSDGPRPTLNLPGTIDVAATSPAGAKVQYDATATGADGKPVPVECDPPSGATFPIGTTDVLCTATDPQTKAVGLGSFLIRVTDGPPVVDVPKDGITAEAQNPMGALVSYDITASDAVDGKLPVSCFPSAPPGMPALFLLDVDTTVTCSATDSRGQTGTGTFVVRVRDTTPPKLCELKDIKVPATTPTGAFVKFDTCATDLVDVTVPVTCVPPSGSFFSLGDTKVTCGATDKHGNRATPASFIVTVSDTTPPKLILPGPIDVVATSRLGAIVKYEVSAKDNLDPDPVVSCTPPSGSRFPLGTTVVKCTATDDAGNVATGTFPVRVRIGWTNLLPPIPLDGSGQFRRPKPLRVAFALSGASEKIENLEARLYLAPLDKLGNPGPEIPAPGLPGPNGNLFRFNYGQYEYQLLLETRELHAGPWRLRTDLGDGVLHTVKITLL